MQRMSSLLAADREFAPCRESKGGRDEVRARRRGRAWGGGGASGMHREGPTQGLRVRARAERTWNMASMFVTLEVSKLSGWLKAYASCRVEGRGMRCGARCGPGGGRA